MFPTNPEHGTRSRYVNYSCRCTQCKRANRDYQRWFMAQHYFRTSARGSGGAYQFSGKILDRRVS